MKIDRLVIGGIGVAAFFAANAQVIVRPPYVVVPQIVVPQPVVVAPQPVMVAPGVAGVEYVPTPLDTFVVNAAPADVVFLNGDTYVWAVDANGHRYRRFYGHGDRREEVFHRREELHRVMERNGGHLPERAMERRAEERGMEHRAEVAHIEQREAMARQGELAHANVAAAAQARAGTPQAHAALAAQAHPAAPAPQAHPAAPAPQAHAAAPKPSAQAKK